MKVLFIAPLPPPVNGQSVVSQHLLNHLREWHDVLAVNISKRSLKEGVDSVGRIREVFRALRAVNRQRQRADTVYLTISESVAGNLRDLLVCLLCRRLWSRTYIHLHGGSLKKLLYDQHKSIYWMNKIVFRRLAGAIVSGPSHQGMFDGILDRGKVHVAANFAEDEMFVDEPDVVEKFSAHGPIRVLYVSHMTERKGYGRLAEALLRSGDRIKAGIQIEFAGAFEREVDKNAFLDKIRDEPSIRYHGVVSDEAKRSLFRRAHVFALPTSFLEGQPISILEAYAAGCVVMATSRPGVSDVFQDPVNGFQLSDGKLDDITAALSRLAASREHLLRIALRNRSAACRRYRAAVSLPHMRAILENGAQL
jgi:glycosyltransferase involved in cell wall biosynthesis